MTAWFSVCWTVFEPLTSPDLLPEQSEQVRVRLRFYDLSFSVLQPVQAQPLALASGRFREAAVGVPARHAGVDGEVSLFLWADSDTYLMWGREAFGWPIVRGQIELAGAAWDAVDATGAAGEARVTDEWGMASMTAVLGEPTESGWPTARWFTPRRVLERAGLDGETRQLLVVSPTVRNAGTRRAARGRVSFAFGEGHPLAAFPDAEAEIDFVDGFQLVVGDNVELA